MSVLIDNKDLKSVYGIDVLDYTGALAFPSIREDHIEWTDKSGIDPNLENVRYDSKEFIMSFVVQSSNELQAYNLVKTLVDYMRLKRVFVLSIIGSGNNGRQAFLCERSNTIIPEVNIRQQNSLYTFKIGFNDINPNAVHYQPIIVGLSATINYEKGQTAVLYWGDGSREVVSNSGNYTKTDYDANGMVDIFVDIDADAAEGSPLGAAFSGNPTSGDAGMSVAFTDESTGDPVIWSWDFGDGSSSALQNPTHIYAEGGSYTVKLQIFNDVSGSDTVTKTSYITVGSIVADFSGTPLSGSPVLDTQFTDLSTGSPTSWAWNFGDGETSTEQNPLHSYAVTGVYSVSLTINNASGGASTKTKTDYVEVSLPDFDSNVSEDTITAMVSKPFTFKLEGLANSLVTVGGGVRCRLTLNGVVTNYDFASGTFVKDMSITHVYSAINGPSYFEFWFGLLSSGSAIDMSLVYNKGTLEMIDAGMTRFSMWGASTDIFPWNISLKTNDVVVSDINTFVALYEDTAAGATSSGVITFDISGGTNAVPTSAEAIAVKNTLTSNQLYYDNE